MANAVRAGDPLAPFFSPATIAIIGASADETKIGGRPIRNLRLAGYGGTIIPVNPARAEVQGLRTYASVRDAPGPIDLAIVAVPADRVLGAVEDCAACSVRAAIIFSAGFAEVGPAGVLAQDRIVAVAQAAGMRVLGPNCLGTINTAAGVIATFTSGIVEEAPRAGRISLASQSGAFGSHCLALMRQRGLAVNLWATTGNQSDVEVADFIAYMATDPATDVILANIEAVRNGARFVEALELARRNRKPVVVMKVGRSDAGAAAMASHTASLAGSDAVFDAVLQQYGAIRADSIDALLDIAYACSFGRFPGNKRLGIVTVSGGVGVLMADAASEAGLDVAPLTDDVQAKLTALLPYAGTRNPIDVTAQVINDPGLVEPMLGLLLSEGCFDSVVTFLAHLGLNPAIIAALQPGLKRVAERYPDRYLSISLLADPNVRNALEDMGYAVFEDPSRAVQAAATLARFTEIFALQGETVTISDDVPRVDPDTTYDEHGAKALLRSAGIPAPEERVVTESDAAVAAANTLNYPVVLKIVSPDILHKSEIGGVLLNLADEEAVREGFATLMARAGTAAPDARIEGVLVAPMIRGGIETVIGVARDPLFGPIVMVGLGGVLVEVLRDVAFRRAPFGMAEAHRMIDSLRGRPILDGVRGAPPADIAALALALVNLSIFAAANADTVGSIDVNPLLVMEQGRGVVAADALIETILPTHTALAA